MPKMFNKDYAEGFTEEFINAIEEHFTCSIEDLDQESDLKYFRFNGEVYRKDGRGFTSQMRVRTAKDCNVPNLDLIIRENAIKCSFRNVYMESFTQAYNLSARSISCTDCCNLVNCQTESIRGKHLSFLVRSVNAAKGFLKVKNLKCNDSTFNFHEIDFDDEIFDDFFHSDKHPTQQFAEHLLKFSRDAKVVHKDGYQTIVNAGTNNFVIRHY